MQDCNSVETPFPVGVTLSKLDNPKDAAEEDIVREKVNKMFNTNYRTYTEIRNFYCSITSSIGWVVKMIAPTAALAHSLLGRAMYAPSVAAFKAAKHVLRFFRGHTDMKIVYQCDKLFDWRNGEVPSYWGQSDSSFADDPDDRFSQGGYIAGVQGQSPSVWKSGKPPRLCNSTNQAESIWASLLARELEYKSNVFIFLGLRDSNSPRILLECDNQATTQQAGAPIRKFSASTKHFDIDEKYVQQLVEEGLLKVVHVPGSIPTKGADKQRARLGFPVDMMTKPLSAPVIKVYYPQLHGPVKG
jgi:hypothetical protein